MTFMTNPLLNVKLVKQKICTIFPMNVYAIITFKKSVIDTVITFSNNLTTMVLYLSSSEFLLLGLDLSGFDEQRNKRTCAATNFRRFHSSFGASPQSCSNIFSDLQTISEHVINKPNPVYFMMALSWLSIYSVEEEMAGAFKIVEETVRKWIWEYTHAIQALKRKR